MKNLLFAVLFIFFLSNIFGQISNVKAGLWSDSGVWPNHTLPTVSDDIVLQYDIIVDMNAACKSFTLNGHNATINAGVNLNIAGNAETSSALLKQYIELDTTKTAPSDIMTTVQFTYDGAKRLIRTIANDYIYNHTRESLMFYDGMDTLPVRSINFSYSPSSEVDTSMNYYFYNEQFKLVKDSLSYWPGAAIRSGTWYELHTFRYSAGGIQSAYKKVNVDMSEYTESYSSSQTYQNGNIVTQMDTADNGAIVSSRFVYDKKINPFNKISLNHYPIFDFESHHTDNFQINNITEITQSYADQQYLYSHHYRYSYQYNSRNYPVSITIENVTNPDIDVNKAMFIYED